MMLPSVPKSLGRLSDVFGSALNAITGKKNTLGLPRVKNACVIMVDGLGSANIEFRAGHAPTLSRQLQVDGSIHCGFPSTTVASLASFATGLRAGQHGLVGYQIYDRSRRQNVNLLTGISGRDEALKWQPMQTISEAAADEGVQCFFVGPAEYDQSGFTLATMRSATYVPAKSIEDRFAVALKIISSGANNLVYLYVPELDQKAHAFGSKSSQWAQKLEDLEASVKKFVQKTPATAGVLLTADHGIIDVDTDKHIYLDEVSLPSLQSVGGDPRVLYLYLKEESIAATKETIQSYVGKRAYVALKSEIIEAGWFGPVADWATERLPELFVVSLGETALYHRDFAKPKSLSMIGQHGSISSEELNIPLLRFAGFAKKYV